MTQPAAVAEPLRVDESPDSADRQVLRATEAWLDRAVIGLNLCPFARAPRTHGRLRLRVSRAQDVETLLADLCAELQTLHAADPQACETTLLIHPDVLTDFLDYNDFLDIADAALSETGLEGELQIASFHPAYQFAGSEPDAIENYTNRAPYPMLHLLREASIERAVESIVDPDAIYRRNIATLRKLGLSGWQALLRDDETPSPTAKRSTP
jgi:hypothetical protein